MELVLKAIKSLFRKLENSISANITALTKKINNAQNTADTAINKANTAQETADNAISKANTAQETADNAQFPILTVKAISGSTGIINDTVKLVTGMIYAIVSNVNSTSNSIAFLKINGTSYAVEFKEPSGQIDAPINSMSTSSIYAKNIFKSGAVTLVQYWETTTGNCFITLNSYNMSNYIERENIKEGNYCGFVGPLSINSNNTISALRYNKDLILSSTTADSTKKFKVLVDDTGTLTTEEIV